MPNSAWPRITIESLIASGAIVAHKDGNYGSLYPRVEEFVTIGVPFLTAKSLDRGRIDIEAAPRLAHERADVLRFGFVRADDVLLSHNATVGRVAVVPHFDGRLLVGTSLTYFRLNPHKLLPRYFAAYLTGEDFQNQLAAVMSHSTRNQVPITAQRKLSVVVPPLAVQDVIAGVLGALDDKMEQNRRTARALERLARTMFNAWFVDFEPVKAKAAGHTSFPGMHPAAFAALPDRLTDSALGLVPQGWAVVDVYQLAKVVYGAPFASKLFNDKGEGKHLVRIRDLQTHSPSIFTTEQHPKGTVIRPGEIVVGMDGEFRLHYWTGPEAWLNQRLCSFKPLPRVPTVYLGEALRAPLDYVERSEAATTVIHLGKYDIDRFELLRPDDATLAEFDSITTPLLNLIVQSSAESAKLALLRGYLLPRLLSGQVRASDVARFTKETL
jgi:type I restriction enzyme S subunit